MARRYFEYSYFCFNPLDRGNSNQMLGDRDFSFNAIIPRFNPLDRGNSNQMRAVKHYADELARSLSFNPLDRGNSNQIEDLEFMDFSVTLEFQSPRSGKF